MVLQCAMHKYTTSAHELQVAFREEKESTRESAGEPKLGKDQP